MRCKTKAEFKEANSFGLGFTNFLFAKNMTGKTYMRPLKIVGKQDYLLANVSFAPGARCFWHAHRAGVGGGQVIICTAGEGWYQEEGKEAISLSAGDVVDIPTDTIHWHGAKADSWFSHVTLEIGGENVRNEFVRPVSDEEYAALEQGNAGAANGAGMDAGFASYASRQCGFQADSTVESVLVAERGARPSLTLVELSAGTKTEWIAHDKESMGELVVCVGGEGCGQTGGRRGKRVAEGVSLLVPAGERFSARAGSGMFSLIRIELPILKKTEEHNRRSA